MPAGGCQLLALPRPRKSLHRARALAPTRQRPSQCEATSDLLGVKLEAIPVFGPPVRSGRQRGPMRQGKWHFFLLPKPGHSSLPSASASAPEPAIQRTLCEAQITGTSVHRTARITGARTRWGRAVDADRVGVGLCSRHHISGGQLSLGQVCQVCHEAASWSPLWPRFQACLWPDPACTQASQQTATRRSQCRQRDLASARRDPS